MVESVEKMLRQVFGGCPKRGVCRNHQPEGKTCVYGPYKYCGKYRSMVKPKRKAELNQIILDSQIPFNV